MDLLARAASGSLAGVAATVVLTGLRKTLAGAGIVGESAPEQVIKRLDELGLLDGWSPQGRRLLTVIAHVAYGAGVGASFSLFRPVAGKKGEDASVGAALGVLGWAVNWAGVLPITGVHSPPWRQYTPKVLLPVLDHAVFGAAWGLVYRLLRRSGDV